MRVTIDRIGHVVLNVKDVEICRVLGMECEKFGADNRTALKFGGQKINLRPADADPESWTTGANDLPGSGDLCFITAVGPKDVIGHLQDLRGGDPGRPRRA
jgi:hypothetical protein